MPKSTTSLAAHSLGLSCQFSPFARRRVASSCPFLSSCSLHTISVAFYLTSTFLRHCIVIMELFSTLMGHGPVKGQPLRGRRRHIFHGLLSSLVSRVFLLD